jgi:hypothetical protein
MDLSPGGDALYPPRQAHDDGGHPLPNGVEDEPASACTDVDA